MTDILIKHPFTTAHLSKFYYAPETINITNEDIFQLDRELTMYEQVFINPDIEKSLIGKNELLASFAISKAENSQLTLKEARDVYELVTTHPDYNFISQKLQTKTNLTQKDYDQLEFFNIVRSFRLLNQQNESVFKLLSTEFILTLHQQLTQGLDIFKDYLPAFTVYKSGKWRDNDAIRVDSYTPAPFVEIPAGVVELIDYVKTHQTPLDIALFHGGLYALHPFNNGNKRVCRILEHLLLRGIGINPKNLYSTSYYYHLEKERYYKHLLYSLEKYNLNHLTSFILESIALSIISVLKTSIEVKRKEFLDIHEVSESTRSVINPLIKRNEAQFKHLLKNSKGKVARQTLVTYLQRAVNQGVLTRREEGKRVFYHINTPITEWEILKKWINRLRPKLPYIPDDILLA
ncbi:MAG TPA: hypothetical protein DEP87_01800 [Candidatus Pacebacteria bacterium]|nr:hypothetical protein [Candidatus Paceibacterota bacterium]